MISANQRILHAAVREKTELVAMLYGAKMYDAGVLEYIELQKLKLKLKGVQIADTRRGDQRTDGDTPSE